MYDALESFVERTEGYYRGDLTAIVRVVVCELFKHVSGTLLIGTA